MLRRITEDLYDIAWRVKALSDGYEIYYDTEREKYVLYHGGCEQLVFPYARLDQRAISHVIETRVEYLDQLMKKVDERNAALERKNLLAAQDKFEDGIAKALRSPKH